LLLGPMFVMAKLFIALGFRDDLATIIAPDAALQPYPSTRTCYRWRRVHWPTSGIGACRSRQAGPRPRYCRSSPGSTNSGVCRRIGARHRSGTWFHG
jgi:hypothetical protein